ncbi:hypothetical protein [Streptomyces sp. CBMA156]|uniref:hypothetical protein n=1 Tax=Streptomyces sp. CBMA156 TaxID=1930280 RepID=UPI001CB80236|nr:hypothetical protein [Streptomyces sp. CBMA156]
MHESSTAGGDEAPREDGATKDGGAKDGGTGAAAPGGAPTDRTGQDGAATPPPLRDPVRDPVKGSVREPAGEGAEPQAPVDRRPRRTPERSQAEQDEIFAALVAQFDDPVDLNNPNWPEVENLRAQNELKGGHKSGPDGHGDQDDLSDLAPQPRPRSGRPVMPAGGSGPRDFELAEETDEGHFVPPEPPPLPAADVTAKFAWLAVLGGPALLLVDAVVWREVSGWPAWVGITAFLGGFVTLVARMKDRDEDEPEDPDNGAVV